MTFYVFILLFQGMKVVSGSLDVLETVGKKTFDVGRVFDERKFSCWIWTSGFRRWFMTLIENLKEPDDCWTSKMKNHPQTFVIEEKMNLSEMKSICRFCFWTIRKKIRPRPNFTRKRKVSVLLKFSNVIKVKLRRQKWNWTTTKRFFRWRFIVHGKTRNDFEAVVHDGRNNAFRERKFTRTNLSLFSKRRWRFETSFFGPRRTGNSDSRNAFTTFHELSKSTENDRFLGQNSRSLSIGERTDHRRSMVEHRNR